MSRGPRHRSTDKTITGQALQLWRVTKNLTDPRWSQVFTADWLGVSPRMYRRWENGDWPVPRYVSQRIEEYEHMTNTIEQLRSDLQAAEAAAYRNR